MRPFEEVVAEHGPAVLRVCRALLPAADADDAWSETFLAAMRAYPDLRPGSNVRGWLVTIAHNKAIDLIRVASRTAVPAAEPPEVTSSMGVPGPGTDGALRAAIDDLPTKQRGAVVYRYLADLPYSEVGTLLGTSEAAARRNAADGIAKLRTIYPQRSNR